MYPIDQKPYSVASSLIQYYLNPGQISQVMVKPSIITEVVLAYIGFLIGTVFSFLTVLLILINCKQMFSNLYARLMLFIQLFLLMGYIDYIVMIPWLRETCQATGAIFYFFFLLSNFITEMMLLLIYYDLNNMRDRYRKMQLYLLIAAVVVSAVVAFVPINHFQPCYVGELFFYCGECFQNTSSDFSLALVGMGIYVLPCVIGLGQLLLLCKIKKKLIDKLMHRFSEITSNQKQALDIIFIPFISIILIICNLISHALYYCSNQNQLPHPNVTNVFVVFLGSGIYFMPLVNFIFFSRFVKRGDIGKLKINKCRCLFCLKEKQKEQYLGEQLTSL